MVVFLLVQENDKLIFCDVSWLKIPFIPYLEGDKSL